MLYEVTNSQFVAMISWGASIADSSQFERLEAATTYFSPLNSFKCTSMKLELSLSIVYISRNNVKSLIDMRSTSWIIRLAGRVVGLRLESSDFSYYPVDA